VQWNLSNLTNYGTRETCLIVRQHESQQKPDLDYEEITPCLKEVTLQWEEMLMEEDRDTRFSPQNVLECVKKGGNLRLGHCLRMREKKLGI
jgi:hypothetical protein